MARFLQLNIKSIFSFSQIFVAVLTVVVSLHSFASESLAQDSAPVVTNPDTARNVTTAAPVYPGYPGWGGGYPAGWGGGRGNWQPSRTHDSLGDAAREGANGDGIAGRKDITIGGFPIGSITFGDDGHNLPPGPFPFPGAFPASGNFGNFAGLGGVPGLGPRADTRFCLFTAALFNLLEGNMGALVMVAAGVMAVVSSAFGAYKAAINLLAVAVGSFILRSLVEIFFNFTAAQGCFADFSGAGGHRAGILPGATSPNNAS